MTYALVCALAISAIVTFAVGVALLVWTTFGPTCRKRRGTRYYSTWCHCCEQPTLVRKDGENFVTLCCKQPFKEPGHVGDSPKPSPRRATRG